MNQIVHENVTQELMLEAYETLHSRVAEYTFPISLKDKARYDLHGSGVGVQIDGVKYIATAGHLVRDLLDSKRDYYAHPKKLLLPLKNRPTTFSNDYGPDYDICLIEIEDGAELLPAFPSWNFYVGDKLFTTNFEYIQGFPVKKNTIRRVSKKGFGYISNQIKFDPSIAHNLQNVSEKTHWLFKLNGGLYGNSPQKMQKFGPNNMPCLKGLSGCGMWCMSDVKNAGSIKLAGIFTMYEDGVGAGTKIKHLKQLARSKKTP